MKRPAIKLEVLNVTIAEIIYPIAASNPIIPEAIADIQR